MKNSKNEKQPYFTKGETALWTISCFAIIAAFCIFDKADFLTLIASIIGVTSLLFNAKRNPFGQVLMITFSVCYGIISWSFGYYGEMLTYLGMTAPMAAFSLVSWLRHPYNGKKSQVEINKLTKKEIAFSLILTLAVTAVFYFILKALDTSNLIPSTVSVTTSFIAVYLTFRRSPYFAVAYAANDAVLIVLWSAAAFSDISYLSVVVCFSAFFINDVYGFINWNKIKKLQKEKDSERLGVDELY